MPTFVGKYDSRTDIRFNAYILHPLSHRVGSKASIFSSDKSITKSPLVVEAKKKLFGSVIDIRGQVI